MPSLLSSLDPIRLLDEITTRLGSLVLDAVPRLTAFLRSLTQLPAGIQVLIVIGGLGFLTLCFFWMRKALLEAAAIREDARQARLRSREAQAELAIRDRHKAFAYIMFLGVALAALLLAVFVYQSIVHAGGPETFQGP